MTDRPTPLERAVDVALFAPFTVTAKIVEGTPGLVSRVHQHLLLAHFMGKLAVKQGTEELRRRLEGDRGSPGPTAVAEPRSVTPPESADAPVGPPAGDLALPDYEHLPAAHVVSKLPTLSPAELDLIEEYERAHRHRRTVLGKIDQLRAASP